MRKTMPAILLIIANLFATESVGQLDFLQEELNLSYHCDVMMNAAEGRHRAKAMDVFNTEFIRVLSDKSSVSYPFDSLKWISKLEPDDQSFRIFTWEVRITEEAFKYFGVVQKKDGTISVLNDRFEAAEDKPVSEYSADSWLGSVYYNMLSVQDKKEGPYYLLFGLHRAGKFENVKLIDPIFFTAEGDFYFGKPVFRQKTKEESFTTFHRILLRYSADARVTVNFNPGMNMIIADHLIEHAGRLPGQAKVMVPDGSYIGFEKEGGLWNYVDKIATEVMETAPRPKPVLDARKGKKIFGND